MPAPAANPLTPSRALNHFSCPLPAGEGAFLRVIAFLALIALAACATVTRAPVTPPPQTAHAVPAQAACSERRFEGDGFIVCPYEPAHQELRLVSKSPAGDYVRTFAALDAALGKDAPRVAFAMNAGMFEEDGAPVGFYVQNGEEQHRLVTNSGTGNFYLKPNGVFFVDGSGIPHVATTESYAAREATPQWATQSGPMLVSGNALNPHFQDDGPSHYVRNGVGVAGDGETTFAISEAPVSFGKFARLFRDALHCPNALYFDGNVSSLWAPSLGREDHGRALGPMVVVLDKPPALTQ
ncbi:MAG: phosphodiester glycosidase family protein [Alphaproteobacteria bacterium]